MGYIKEPKGVDFIIKSEPLTNEERAAISEFIHQFKVNNLVKKSIKKKAFPSSRKVRLTKHIES